MGGVAWLLVAGCMESAVIGACPELHSQPGETLTAGSEAYFTGETGAQLLGVPEAAGSVFSLERPISQDVLWAEIDFRISGAPEGLALVALEESYAMLWQESLVGGSGRCLGYTYELATEDCGDIAARLQGVALEVDLIPNEIDQDPLSPHLAAVVDNTLDDARALAHLPDMPEDTTMTVGMRATGEGLSLWLDGLTIEADVVLDEPAYVGLTASSGSQSGVVLIDEIRHCGAP